jgi:hypothetical protein
MITVIEDSRKKDMVAGILSTTALFGHFFGELYPPKRMDHPIPMSIR